MSRKGVASGTFKHGRYSKYAPLALGELYEQYRTDPKLLSLRDEIAFTKGLIVQQMQRMEFGDSPGFREDLERGFGVFEKAMRDGTKEDVADSLRGLKGLVRTGVEDDRARDKLLDLFERLRRLVESERDAIVQMRLVLSVEDATAMVHELVSRLKENIKDEALLVKLQREIAQVVDLRRNRGNR